MDYYTKIKDELINNEVYKRVKDCRKKSAILLLSLFDKF